jgi:hypothetical protein
VGRVRDPYGNVWWIQAHVIDVPANEMESRMREPKMIKAMQYVADLPVHHPSVSAELRTMKPGRGLADKDIISRARQVVRQPCGIGDGPQQARPSHRARSTLRSRQIDCGVHRGSPLPRLHRRLRRYGCLDREAPFLQNRIAELRLISDSYSYAKHQPLPCSQHR